MAEAKVIEELRDMVQSIRDIGIKIETKSVQSDIEINQSLKSGKEMCEKYLNKNFVEDSFNI